VKRLALLFIFVLSACAGGAQQSVPITAQAGVQPGNPIETMTTTTYAAVPNVQVIIMENYAYEQVIGNSSAPYINSLAKQYALFTNSHGVGHPSQPNYLALFSGSTQGVTSDVCPISFSGSNLDTQLTSTGRHFTFYAESLPYAGDKACYAIASTGVSSHYLYWRKHNPAADFTNSPATHQQPWTGPRSSYPGLTFIAPNICHDMHDCSIATGDAWLKANVPSMLSYDNANNGMLIITYDEGEYSLTNHVVTILAGPMIKPGQYTQYITHYNVLRLLETNYGVPLLGSAASATSISGWHK
jgi:hypothetical protein